MSSSRRDQSNSRAPAPPPAQDGASRQLLPMAAPSVTASMAARSGNPVNIVNGIPVTPSTFPRQQVLQPARQGTQITGSEDGRDARTDEEQYDGDDDDLDGQLMPIQDPRSGPHVITVPSVIVARSDVPSHQAPKLRTQKNTGIRRCAIFCRQMVWPTRNPSLVMCDAGCAPRCGRATKMTLVFMLLSLMLAICCVTFYAICTARVGLDSKICPENATVADILDGVADPRADPRDFVRNAVSKRVQLDASSSDRGTDKGPSEEIVSQYSCRPWFLLLVASAALLTTSILAFSCSGRISFAWEKSKRSE